MTEQDIITAIQSIIPNAPVTVMELDPWRAKVRIGVRRYLVYWNPVKPKHLLFFSLGDLDPGYGRVETEGLKARFDRAKRERRK